MRWEIFDNDKQTLLQILPAAAITNNCNGCPLYERRLCMKQSIGDGFLKEIFYRDFSIIYGNIYLQNNRLVKFERAEPAVKMIFQFCGNREVFLNKPDTTVHFENNHHYLLFTPKNTGSMRLSGCERQHFLEINLHPHFIKPYLPDGCIFQSFIKSIDEHQNALFNLKPYLINVQMEKIISELTSDYNGQLKRLFFESKIKTLLLLQIENFLHHNQKTTSALHQEHHEKIFLAKSIIEQNLTKPCSLINLAKQVGTNECTLKKGFRELLDTTVFTYWNDLKMQKAYEMLSEGSSSITDIAYDSGFKTVQHFTSAFKKKFGITPGAARKNPQ